MRLKAKIILPLFSENIVFKSRTGNDIVSFFDGCCKSEPRST